MSATGGFKKCPICGEQIREEAVKCRYCGEWLEKAPEPKSQPKQEHEKCPEPAQVETSQEPIKPSGGFVSTVSEQEPSTPTPSLGEVEQTESPPHEPQQGLGPMLPLFFIFLWIFGYVVPLAIKNGASGALGMLLGTISYCTTPGSIVLLPLLGIWFWSARRKRPLFQTLSELFRQPGWPLLLIIVGGLGLFAFSYSEIHPALEYRNAAQRQKLTASEVNADALKDWEVAKGADQSAVDARLGFPAATKKRMRETFALSLMGAVGSVPSVKVELQGAEHDRLIVYSPTMNATIASNLPVVLRTADADFWNRTRFLGFSEFVFSGSNYHQSIPAAKFAQWGTGYDTFVSNMVAMYDTSFGQAQSPTSAGGELNPSMQKMMRQNFASVFKGAFGAIYKALDVRLEGEDEDKLVFYIKEMDAATANELLKVLKDDNKGRNFGNALRAMAFQELTFKGDNFNVSYSKTNFVEWCYNYENYLSELRKAAAKISGAVKSQ